MIVASGWTLVVLVGTCGLLLGVTMPVYISYGQQLLPHGQRVASSITMGVSWGIASGFGIRRALGAQASDLMRLVLTQGFALAAAGLAVGAVASLWAGRFVAPLLFEERSPRDPAAFALAALVLLAAALAASIVPARRAAHVDPRQALQAE